MNNDHNHTDLDVKSKGLCSACDEYHAQETRIDKIKALKRAQKALYLVAEEDVADDINKRINDVLNMYLADIANLRKQLSEVGISS